MIKARLVFLIALTVTSHSLAVCSDDVAAQSIRIHRLTSSSQNLASFIDKVLVVQHALVVDRTKPIPPQGFLLGKWSQVDLLNHIKNGTLFAAETNGEVVGYTIVYGGYRFVDGLDDTSDTVTSLNGPLPDLNQLPYLSQIGVLPEFQRLKVGRRLVEEVKNAYPYGVFVGIMEQPYDNVASWGFFQNHGFRQFAVWESKSYKDFGAKRTRLAFWKSED